MVIYIFTLSVIILLLLLILYYFKKPKIYIFSIEGNIGSGKSTLVKLLSQFNPHYHFLQEPVNIWKELKDSNENNILSEFYKDQNRYAYIFQNFAFITRITTLLALIAKVKSMFQDKYIIVERCIYSDKNVFAKMLYDNKKISELEYKIYNYWFYKLHNKVFFSGHIYLEVDTNVAAKRINKRSRSEEDSIPLEYLESLNEYHKKWLDNTPVPVITINVNDDFEYNKTKFIEINSKIVHFITHI